MKSKNTHTTAKGTVLPLLDFKGKDYLEVKFRIVWFREEHPTWSIETELVTVTEKSSCARATIKDEAGRVISTSHKFENVQGFPDFIEKSETGSIGRALALIGYGTQFCADELDEGKRIVDAPVEPKQKSQAQKNLEDIKEVIKETGFIDDGPLPLPTSDSPAGDYVINFGKKYPGRAIKSIPPKELAGYIDWLVKNGRLDSNARSLIDAAKEYGISV
jgi:hypothetical protein